jgi:hypothetical protein
MMNKSMGFTLKTAVIISALAIPVFPGFMDQDVFHTVGVKALNGINKVADLGADQLELGVGLIENAPTRFSASVLDDIKSEYEDSVAKSTEDHDVSPTRSTKVRNYGVLAASVNDAQISDYLLFDTDESATSIQPTGKKYHLELSGYSTTAIQQSFNMSASPLTKGYMVF